MKDLSKYISNKFEKTPSLNNYITEKVLIGKNTKFSKNTATVFLVKTDEDDDDWRPLSNGITDDMTVDEVKIPLAKWYIYKDKYHGRLHIASLNDMRASIIVWHTSYEDFSPEDIIYSADTLKEIMDYCIKQANVNINIDNFDSVDELWDSRIPEKIKTKLRLYDSDSFIANAIFNGKTGNEHDLDFKNFDNIDDILDYAGY